jgi:hypothetical protein
LSGVIWVEENAKMVGARAYISGEKSLNIFEGYL